MLGSDDKNSAGEENMPKNRTALRFAAFLAFGILLLLAFSRVSAPTQSEPQITQEKSAEVLPATLAGFEDQGKFRIYVNEEPIAEILFNWAKNGFVSSTVTLKMAGQSVTVETKIEADAKGLWTRILQSSAQGKAELTRTDGTVSRTIVTSTAKEIKDTIELKPGVVLFDNYGPALMSQMIRLYDSQKGGKQKFQIFILPGRKKKGKTGRSPARTGNSGNTSMNWVGSTSPSGRMRPARSFWPPCRRRVLTTSAKGTRT
jgi:hypothetical protein